MSPGRHGEPESAGAGIPGELELIPKTAAHGRTAIITGAASGMGRATALRFARDHARVAVADLNATLGEQTVELVQAAGGEAVFVETDVTRESSVEHAVAKAAAILGPPNVLVNFAGIAFSGGLGETTEADWDRVIDTNLKGTFLMVKHVIPRLLTNGGGAIVNVASNAGLHGVRNLSAYCASKGAVIQLTKALALEYGDKNIRVNAIAPTSTVRTQMFDARLGRAPDPTLLSRAIAAANPMKRLGTPEDVAELVAYLSSDSAAYMTGGIFPVDGGFSASGPTIELPPPKEVLVR